VLVEEIDVIDAEALKRALAGPPDVLWASVRGPVARRVGIDHEPELGRDLELVALAGDGPPEELLVGVGAVDLGGVEKRDPQLERAVDRRQACLLVAGAVGPGHAHASQALGRYLQALASQSSSNH
jgi:hypothetical protein